MKPVLGTQLDMKHPLNKGLVGCWEMNERAGLVASDISSYKNNCTLSGVDRVPGKFGNCVSLDDDPDGITIDNDISLLFTTEASLIMTIKLNSNIPSGPSKTGIEYFYTASNDSHYPWVDGGIYLNTFRNGSRITVGNIGIDKSKWHMIAITTSPGANNWKFYQNAVEYYSATGQSTVTMDSTQYIGKSGGAHSLDGLIDKVRIYNRALTASEIMELYVRK